jgi:hypothetical protein
MNSFGYTWIFLLLAQVLVWLQLNGQFVWPWFKNNTTLTAVLFAIPISLLFTHYQKHAYVVFDQSLWSIRLFGFGFGMIIFFIMTLIFREESLNLKNALCIGLSAGIVLIQVFVK